MSFDAFYCKKWSQYQIDIFDTTIRKYCEDDYYFDGTACQRIFFKKN